MAINIRYILPTMRYKITELFNANINTECYYVSTSIQISLNDIEFILQELFDNCN